MLSQLLEHTATPNFPTLPAKMIISSLRWVAAVQLVGQSVALQNICHSGLGRQPRRLESSDARKIHNSHSDSFLLLLLLLLLLQVYEQLMLGVIAGMCWCCDSWRLGCSQHQLHRSDQSDRTLRHSLDQGSCSGLCRGVRGSFVAFGKRGHTFNDWEHIPQSRMRSTETRSI
jgi:hypothetical protein